MPEPDVNELFDLAGQVALVSGASGHLGFSLASALAEAGASVVVTSRDHGRAQQTASRLTVRGRARHTGVVLDHMDDASVRRGFNEAVTRMTRLDILVNNGHEAVASDWTNVTPAEFSRQLQNATGYFSLARLTRDHAVQKRRPASIILIGSMYGVVGSYPDAYEGLMPASPVAYHALKGAVVQMTRHLAVYWARDAVRVNCLSPGPFPNDARVPAELVARLESKSPMGRMGQPHELKGAMLLLASPAGSYITGQNIVVDGGWTAW